MMKRPTGIAGFDAMTGGGLPTGRTTLIEGGPGSGKTVFALQSLVHGALAHGEPGIFVAFEESRERITANASAFGWDLPALEQDRLFFLDAQPDPDLIRSGEFDLAGMLAALDARVAAMAGTRIVFDALDIVLALMSGPAAARRETYRLHKWLLERGLTALITAKAMTGSREAVSVPPLDFMQFMVDCSILLDHDVVVGTSQRNLRVRKYRGSAFEENATPFVISPQGIAVAFTEGRCHPEVPASTERVATGAAELDRMLNGGYFRGASILLSGAPGTAKTTLCGAFAEAACARGEKTLFVSFDSRSDEIVRNLESVSIRLERHIKSGALLLVSMRALNGSAESNLMRIKTLAREHEAQCVIVDPLSALSKTGNQITAPGVAERLVDWAKAEGMTIMCSSLLDEASEAAESTPLQISTIADTWIHLSYVVRAGERNRGLSIVKSRGTAHSNQVRELVLTDGGVTLTDVYTADGEVLMGTLRWNRERADELAARERRAEAAGHSERLGAEAATIEAQITALRCQLDAKRSQEASLLSREAAYADAEAGTKAQLRERRGNQISGAEREDRDAR